MGKLHATAGKKGSKVITQNSKRGNKNRVSNFPCGEKTVSARRGKKPDFLGLLLPGKDFFSESAFLFFFAICSWGNDRDGKKMRIRLITNIAININVQIKKRCRYYSLVRK